MKILFLGYSDLFQRRIKYSLQRLKKFNIIEGIEVASLTKSLEHNNLIKETYTTYEEAIFKSNAEIIYVSLPNSLHYKYSRLALEANKNVIIDKPSILSLNELNGLYNLASKNKKAIFESNVFAYHRAWDHFKQFKNEVNNVGVLIATFTIPKFHKTNFRNSIALGGGVINDLGAYSMSVGKKFWECKIKSFSVNISKIHNLPISFSINANFGKNKDMLGYFSFNKQYTNSVKFISNQISVKYDRVFSPPYTLNTHLLIENDFEVQKVNCGRDDVFYNFFDDVITKLKQGNIVKINKVFYETNLDFLKLVKESRK